METDRIRRLAHHCDLSPETMAPEAANTDRDKTSGGTIVINRPQAAPGIEALRRFDLFGRRCDPRLDERPGIDSRAFPAGRKLMSNCTALIV